ncbi:MAG: LytS [Clostridiales bacterium]|nr:LytS [Clostridiales bacterium]
MSEDKLKKISFTVEGTNETVDLYVLEQTRLNGINYLLVTEQEFEQEDAEVIIFKEVMTEGTDVIYDPVTDETELEVIAKVFEEILEDFDLEV